MTIELKGIWGNLPNDKTRHQYNVCVVAKALNELARVRGRSDGYTLSVVRDVRDAINNGTEHELKTLVMSIIKHGRIIKPVKIEHESEEQIRYEAELRMQQQLMEQAILEYDQSIDQSLERSKTLLRMRGRRPQRVQNEHLNSWMNGQKSHIGKIPSNAVLFG